MTPPDFLKRCYELIGLSEYAFKFGENCPPPKKTAVKNRRWKKNNFLELNFSSLKQNFFELFFLFLIANCAKFKMQKEKSRKKIFYIWKKTAKRSLVILFALVIYTAPTVDPNPGSSRPTVIVNSTPFCCTFITDKYKEFHQVKVNILGTKRKKYVYKTLYYQFDNIIVLKSWIFRIESVGNKL